MKKITRIVLYSALLLAGISLTAQTQTESLRGEPTVKDKSFIANANTQTFALPSDGTCEITMDIDLREIANPTLTLSNEAGDETLIALDGADRTITVDRSNSGTNEFSEDFPAETTASLPFDGTKLSLSLILDRTTVKVIDAQGVEVLTNLLSPSEPYTTLTVESLRGSARVSGLTIYPLVLKN